MGADWIGWREALILIVVGFAGYSLVILFKLLKVIRRKRAAPAVPDPAAKPSRQPGTPDDFRSHLSERLALADLEREVRQLRAEMEKLRNEIQELRAARGIAPQYGDALALAQRGVTAQQIADRLGISLAEAELVVALSRGESAFRDEKFDEAIDPEQ